MLKLSVAATIMATLVIPALAVAQTSVSDAASPPAKSVTFNGGNVNSGTAVQSDAGAKIVGSGTSGQIGVDTPVKTQTGVMLATHGQNTSAAAGAGTAAPPSQ